jgi:1,4-dihydroxy-2-naphthoate polyprenyltransferase
VTATAERPGGLTVWWQGARPRTLGAGLVPVVLGTAAAGEVIWWRFGAALVVGAGLQVGVNYANDYFDGVGGVDTHERLGPPRLTASGAASPRAVLMAALVALGIAAVAGLALALATEPLLILFVGALALVAAVLYSGGPRPYAGLGLGELMVFLFFGLMATCGTTFVMVETVTAEAWWGGATLGFLAVAILVANNLRDIPTDEASGKHTLAVRIGDRATRRLYRIVVVAAFATIAIGVIVGIAIDGAGLPQWALVGLIAWVLAIRPMDVVGSATGRDLIPVLTGTAATHAACGLLTALGLVLATIDQSSGDVVPTAVAAWGGM